MLVGIGAAACSGDRDEANDRLERDRISAHTAAAEDGPREAFPWPEAGDHPRIGIEIELPGRTGTIAVELMPEFAPASVERVLALSRNGFYDGTTFHRVIPGFMIQGGDPNSRDQDPTNDGRGGDPAPIPDEFSAVPFERGVVALANRGQPGSTSTQLFIMHKETRGLDGQYNAIGRVVEGLELVDAIAGVETDSVGRWGPKDRPIQNVIIRKMTVLSDSPGASMSAASTGIHPETRLHVGAEQPRGTDHR